MAWLHSAAEGEKAPCQHVKETSLRLPFMEYFKPVNYARSTGPRAISRLLESLRVSTCEGIGSTIMGIALMIGMLVTPYAEEAFGLLGHSIY